MDMDKRKVKYIDLYYRNGFYKFRTRFAEDDLSVGTDVTKTVQKWKKYVFKLYSRSAGAANEAKALLLFTLEHDLRVARWALEDAGGVDGFHPTIPDEVALSLEHRRDEFHRLYAKVSRALRDCHA